MENSELKEIVEIITKDSHAIQNWTEICDALNFHSTEFENLARERPIKYIFKSILERWRSENGENATKTHLETVFTNANFRYIADEMRRLNCPKPCFSVRTLKFPLKHNYEGVVANYVSRPELEEKIIKYLTDRQNRLESIDFPVVALHGIGGVGKTTLARIIFRWTTDANELTSELKYFEKNCIWIHAQTEELIIKDFSKLWGIGEKYQHPFKESLSEFYNEQLKRTPCLIIFDNVDDYKMVSNYLPLDFNTKVSVLITSNIEWDSGNIGKVKNIKIEYFTEQEFSIFVSKIIPNVSFGEIRYLDKYTGRIPYLANIVCYGLAKWRKHHSEEIWKYFVDNDEDILEGGIKSGPSFRKYHLNPQEIVERQIKLMQKHEGNDGELAYELLYFLAFCKPDFSKSWLSKVKVESIDVSISILVEYGFLKNNYEEREVHAKMSSRNDMSIHRSYQKAVRSITFQNRTKEEQFARILEMVSDNGYGTEIWDWSAMWETGKDLEDSIIEKMTHNNGIMEWVNHTNEGKSARKTLVKYFKRTRSEKEYLRLIIVQNDHMMSKIIDWDHLHPTFDDYEFNILIEDLKSFDGDFRRNYLCQLLYRVGIDNIQRLEQLFEIFPDEIREEEKTKSFLYWAASHRRLETVKFFISKGFNVNNSSVGGFTPIHWAAIKGDLKIAHALLKAGADPNFVDKWSLQTPLHKMALDGKQEMVKLFLSYNANPNLKNKEGKTALEVVTEQYKYKMMEPVSISSDEQKEYEEVIKLLKGST